MSYRLRLSTEALARTRFAISPLAETVAALQTLRLDRRRTGHLRGWAEWARVQQPRLPALDALLVRTPKAPQFLIPCPPGTYPELDDELATVAATPSDVVAASAERLELAAVQLPQVVGELRVAFDVLVRPYWPRARRILDADVAWRSRQLAIRGFDGLFSTLHRDVTWEEDSVRIWTTQLHESSSERVHDVADDGLVLIPSVFLWPHIWFKAVAPEMAFGYPARGGATLWFDRGDENDALAGVLGATRARLLTYLGVPATPTELARDLNVTIGAVSQHLRILRNAGLVTSARAGRSVVYMRTERGDALLDPR